MSDREDEEPYRPGGGHSSALRGPQPGGLLFPLKQSVVPWHLVRHVWSKRGPRRVGVCLLSSQGGLSGTSQELPVRKRPVAITECRLQACSVLHKELHGKLLSLVLKTRHLLGVTYSLRGNSKGRWTSLLHNECHVSFCLSHRLCSANCRIWFLSTCTPLAS